MENDLRLMNEGLTPFQKLFAERYVLHLNATRAAEEAGTTSKQPRDIGYQNLRHPKVQAYIESLREAQKARMGISMDRVLLELARVAYFDPADLYDDEGVMKPMSEISRNVTAAISMIETNEMFEQDGPGKKRYVGDKKKIRAHDKIKALELLAKHLDGFNSHNRSKATRVVVVSKDEAQDIYKQLDEEY